MAVLIALNAVLLQVHAAQFVVHASEHRVRPVSRPSWRPSVRVCAAHPQPRRPASEPVLPAFCDEAVVV
jgi:hypothetical protein